MPESKTIFVTGATGFLGSHLTYRLMEQGHHVGVLARGSKSASANQRVEEVLNQLGKVNYERLHVFDGDITMPGLGLSEDAMKRIVTSTDEVWHCAASLSFTEEDRDEIFRMNVGGMRNVLELVKRTSTRRLQHLSTAYIAGNRTDLALESDIDVGQTFQKPLRRIQV